ncbi:hypothetical protein [Brevibacillus brevis]|uniref:hypothetical protein n=1 Tax=Brevibacillus brevis TaxID=1393 RepID=UPI0007D8B377|nr:hypothetical protein [Brevibacillus brevis]
MTKKYSVHGDIYTALEYGKFFLDKVYTETEGQSEDPKKMTDAEIEEWAIEFLAERMLEDEEVFEI